MQNDSTPNPDFDSIYSPETQRLVEATGLNVKLSDLSEISALMDETAGQANLAMDSFGPVTQELAAAAKKDEKQYVEKSRGQYSEDLGKDMMSYFRRSPGELDEIMKEFDRRNKKAEAINDAKVWHLVNNGSQKDVWGATRKLDMTEELSPTFTKEELYLTLESSNYLGSPDYSYRIGFSTAMKNLHGVMNRNDFKFFCESLLREGKRDAEDANAKFKLIYNLKDEIGQNFKLARAILEEDIGPKDNWIMRGKDFFGTNEDAFREFLHITKEIIQPDSGNGWRGYAADRLFAWLPVCRSAWKEIRRLKTLLPNLRRLRSHTVNEEEEIVSEFAKDTNATEKLEIFTKIIGEQTDNERWSGQEHYLLKAFSKRSLDEMKALWSWMDGNVEFQEEYELGISRNFILRKIVGESPKITREYLTERFNEFKKINKLLTEKYGDEKTMNRRTLEDMMSGVLNYRFKSNESDVLRIIEGEDNSEVVRTLMNVPILWELSPEDLKKVKTELKKLPEEKMRIVTDGVRYARAVYKNDLEKLMEMIEILKNSSDEATESGTTRTVYSTIYGEDIQKFKGVLTVLNEAKEENAGAIIKSLNDLGQFFDSSVEKLKEVLLILNEVSTEEKSVKRYLGAFSARLELIGNVTTQMGGDIQKLRTLVAILNEIHGWNKSLVSNITKLYKVSPEDFTLENPELKEVLLRIGKFQDGIKNKEILDKVLECSLKKDTKNLKPVLSQMKYLEAFIKTVPSLFTNPKQEPFAKWIFEHFDDLVQDQSDMDFIAQVVGRHGKTAEEIMAGYEECLKAGVLTRTDKNLVLEFLERFRVLSPTIMGGYKKAKAEGSHEVYCARLNDIAGRMTGAGKLTEEERKLPYYDDLLKEVYKNNVGQWTTHENNKTCEDREADLSSYKIKPRYEIDLLSQSEVSLKEGEKSDKTKTDALVESIKKLTTEFGVQGYEPEKMKSSVAKKVDEYFEEVKDNCGIPATEVAALSTEEKISLLVLDSLYGKKKVKEEDLKNLLISYEFAYFEDIRDYIQGTTDRVSRSSNPDYALLCELNTFFSDRIKEINKRVIESGFKNPAVAKVIPAYFEQLSRSTQSVERKGQIAKMQPEKLGASEAFLKQITRSLEGKTGKKYTPEEVRKLVHRYEKMTRGMPESASTSPKQRTKALYGQLRSQREKTRQLAEFITGTEVDPRKIYLGEMNVAELMEAENSISGGTYDATQFEAYTVQKALGLFEEEKDFLTQELAKFVSAGGTERETLNAYIAKNKETANARMVGGVCVSGDNPGKVGPDCQWNMPNYFDLVLEDPDTHRCMGTVLLHSFDEDGKTLAASFNPSSTYLYKVDEKALFKGLLNTLITFAEENGFKRICSSQNTAIRTNRTGGIFEKAMAETITQMGKTYSFSEVKRFSFSPSYEIKDMDVLWQSTATHST